VTTRDHRADESLVDAIADYERGHGFPPTLRDLATRLNRSVSTVHGRCRRLESEGRLEYVVALRRYRVRRVVEVRA